MATPTYTPIATVTASGSSVYLEATAIPSTYTDLIVVLNIKESGSDGLNIQVGNGSYDTGSNYSNTFIQGNGSSAGSGRASNQTYAEVGVESAEWGNTILHFQNYANTNVYKTILSRTNTTNFLVRGVAALWRSTSAIERIRIYNGSNANHAAGSTMTIYGIANAAIGAPKATGGIITYDNTYYYHTFGASGTFTPQQSLTADILCVAGGGGGGGTHGGGGGAGGLLGFASQSLTATGYTVTVGAAGAAGGNLAVGGNGGNSQFGALTAAVGGGGGGSYSTNNAASGGSGGGGAGGTGSAKAGGSPTSGQGYAGGTGGISDGGAGGGGGAGAVGNNGADTTSGAGGNGGNGLSTYSSWGLVTGTGQNSSGTVYYAGGGGGGTNNASFAAGGLGGGGIGSGGGTAGFYGTAGAVNTGGGGGGGNGNNPTPGGAGGSGVVIVRYLKA
jgi:hypothetical protein